MEIGFIAHASRRYLWLVVLCALLGMAGGSVLARGDDPVYVSEGLMSVEPPDGLQQSDRYVATQLVILTASGVTQSVADRPDVPLSPAETRMAVTFTQIAGTDVVRIEARAAKPEVAQAVVQGYMDAYLGVVSSQAEDFRVAERAALQDSIESVEQQLAQVDAQVEALTAPYLGNPLAVIPSIEQLDPALATTRNALTEQYRRLLEARSNFDLTSTGDLSSRLVQQASMPSQASTSEKPIYVVVGLFLGTLLGVALATLLARLSPRVIDAGEAEDIMRTPFVGSVRRRRQFRAPLGDLLFGPDQVYNATIDQVCIRACALGPRGDSLAILVTGTVVPAGTSTVAALVARNLADQGRDVLLIDGDSNSPDLSRDVGSVDPIDQLISADRRERGQRQQSRSSNVAADGRGGSLRISGFPNVNGRAPQLSNVADVIAGARRKASVVVVDGGPLMGSASTVLLSRECDVVVLAVPVRRQRVENLRVVTSQLSHGSAHLLPVITPTLRSRATRTSRPVVNSPQAVENV